MDAKKEKLNASEEKPKIEDSKKDIKIEDKKITEEKPKTETPKKEISKIKKENAVVNAKSVPVSAKYARDICKFIKYKSIKKAINDLEEVILHKRAVPMKGEYAHRKGIGPGKYPERATEQFIKLLKSLSANANVNNLNEPIIQKAFSNIASRPRGRFGKWQRKRTHITMVACEKKLNKKVKNNKNG